ncbi:hypothetical protein B5S31_g3930 [[Candida] boidinii]|nr:hypothetical protein B5S31_g3930 [[Candida] boidinii]
MALKDVTIFQESAIKENDTSAATGSTEQKSIEGPTSTESAAALPIASAPAPAPVVEKLPKSIKEFDNFISDFVQPFVDISEKIDSLVFEQANLFKDALIEERKFLLAATKSKKITPTDPKFAEALTPINKLITEAVELKEKNRSSKVYNNLNTVAEGIPALAWICTDTPVSFIPDFKDSAQFWSNRILKEFKDSDPNQVEWTKLFSKFFDGLKNYVKEYHTTGPTFNNNGGDFIENLNKLDASASVAPVASAAPAAPAAPGASAGGPPPPPPPPPPASVFEVKKTKEETGGMNAVFSELNKGSAITSGLKKVDKSQMTHKNPELRASAIVPSKKGKPVPPKKPSELTNKKPPVRELQDTKWMISNFENVQDMITIEGEMHQSVFISGCSSCVIQIKGKVTTISINDCKKIGVVVDSTISGVDVIRSKSFEIQVVEVVPNISIDQSDSGSIYLSSKSLATEIYTSCTTSLNVNIPDGDDMKELPAPEQFKLTISDKGKLVSSVVEHAG